MSAMTLREIETYFTGQFPIEMLITAGPDELTAAQRHTSAGSHISQELCRRNQARCSHLLGVIKKTCLKAKEHANRYDSKAGITANH
jgi:hypothetical protein